jgi:hypothetical protein
MYRVLRIVVAAGLVWSVSVASARVPASQADKLGQSLTPVGAEQAGNQAGTIPPWTGGLKLPPAGYRTGGFHVDPFAQDPVLFTITRANWKEYDQALTEGQRALFEKYPMFKMPVYPTRRSAALPSRLYAPIRRNAEQAELVGEKVQGAIAGVPFPIPANGAEVIWNHKLRYRGVSVRRWANQAAPTATGAFTVFRIREALYSSFYRPGGAGATHDLLYYRQQVVAPPQQAGEVAMIHDSLKDVRQAWLYNPGQRRVRRAPNLAYDNPGTASDGLVTNDMMDMFNGEMDRFDWKLVGKREVFVPYNAYKADAPTVNPDALLLPGHLKPDLLRYERHRVWVVEARLKAGYRHIVPKRVFYVDEDSWSILAIDHFDASDRLWRYSEAHPINYYELPVLASTLEVHHDLKSGRYFVSGLDNRETPPRLRDDSDPDCEEELFAVQSTSKDLSPGTGGDDECPKKGACDRRNPHADCPPGTGD